MTFSKKDDWFQNCIEDLKLPGSPWYEVSELVAERLAYRIRIEGLTYQQLTKVSKFVGTDFIKKHRLYESLKSTSPTTHSTRLSSDEEVQHLLKDLTLKAAKDAECTLPQDRSSPQCLVDFVNLTKGIFQAHIDKQDESTNSTQKLDGLGKIMVQILQSDPSKLNEIVLRLKGRCLPQCLRKYIYRLLLLKKKKTSAGGEKSNPRSTGAATISDHEMTQKKIREKFAASVKRGVAELKLKQPTRTSISHLIKSSVVETFDTSPGLRALSGNLRIQQESCRVLNVFYTHRRNFEYFYTLWLLPLQTTLTKQQFAKENDYELAMWLDLHISELVPAWPVINQVVLSAWFKATSFSQGVPAFKDYDLRSLLWSMGVSLDQDTVKQILQKGECGTDTQLSSESSSRGTVLKEHYSVWSATANHPIISIRNWVFHLFVGSTKLETTMFIWDQLFLFNWDQRCLKRVCLVLIYCLAKDITLCKNKGELLELFNKGLVNVQLQDIVKAWKHLNDLWPL